MKSDATENFHVPVLLNETITALKVLPEAWYVDTTAGGGGHTAGILEAGGRVLALDQDPDAVKRVKTRFKIKIDGGRLMVREENFARLQATVREAGITPIRGVLFDLGMSSYQIKYSGRGFSFQKDEPLDMRMSRKTSQTVADIVNSYSQDELYEIFRKFGEEHLARQLAVFVSRARAVKRIETTGELRRIAASVYSKARVREKIDPATRMFQALRIAVNDELNSLRQALPQAIEVLESQGRCVVISFHSLEDRIVKQFFLEKAKQEVVKIISKKPVTPKLRETETNPAARSAKLRTAQKL